MSGQEAQYEPIAETTEAEDEATDYKIAEDAGPMDYALHPLKYAFFNRACCFSASIFVLTHVAAWQEHRIILCETNQTLWVG
jgi:hypothetical protein